MSVLPVLDLTDDLLGTGRPAGVVGQRMPVQQMLLPGVTVGFGKEPPVRVPPEFDAVRIGLGVALPALRYLLDTGARVGPCLVCRQHSTVLVPVPLGTAGRWTAPGSECRPSATLNTLALGSSCPPACPSRFWITSHSRGNSAATTDGDRLGHGLHHAMALRRSPAVRDGRCPVSEARCA
ncbi:hypothetical protein ACFVWY_32810 [Streptomyces sp. NPDC058195]|uniref:hypothetical protein n=1 Tax=Streptomyces sp. NPDC058195 TaxID=3346375 RepID=UPI0036E89732